MKTRHVVGLVLFGVALRYIDSMFELILTMLGNFQALHATKTQVEMNGLVPQEEGGDMVIGGFTQHIYNGDEYEEEYEDG